MAMIGLKPGPIPAPEDFPITWDSPEDGGLFWFWDQMHHPHPVTPLTAAIDGPAFSSGTGKAAAALFMPIKAFHVRSVNSYFYFGNEPLIETAEETAAREHSLEALMMRIAPRILQDWETVYLPEVMALNTRLRDYPYAEATPRALADLMDEALANRTRQWELHFLAVFPVMGATFQFINTYEELFGPPENNEHYEMLGGFPNKSVEAGQVLFDLAQDLRALPGVESTIRETPPQAVLAALERTAAGKDAAARLQSYLDEYGWRSDQFELIDRSWREDPTPLVHNLKGYLRQNAVDPRVEQGKAAAERQRLVREMMARVDGNQAQANTLQMFLAMAQQMLPVQENHNFYIDQMNTVLLRLPALEAGRRLTAAGALGEVDDIFFLNIQEIQEALVKPDPSWRALTTQRRADRQRWWKIVPPQFIGTARADADPRVDSLDRFFGLSHEPSRDPRVITGNAASKGVVTGPAKVVRNLGESDKLEPGDILVCEMTMPPWTPLFSIVSAVVADSGGVLSHCAIVAREYGIPCVVGTRIGTQKIRDGQMLTVDGAKGIVRIDG